MGLNQCPECGGKVSSAAAACPHCGHPVESPAAAPEPGGGKTKRARKKRRWLYIGVGVLILFVLAGVIGNVQDNKDRPKKKPKSIPSTAGQHATVPAKTPASSRVVKRAAPAKTPGSSRVAKKAAPVVVIVEIPGEKRQVVVSAESGSPATVKTLPFVTRQGFKAADMLASLKKAGLSPKLKKIWSNRKAIRYSLGRHYIAFYRTSLWDIMIGLYLHPSERPDKGTPALILATVEQFVTGKPARLAWYGARMKKSRAFIRIVRNGKTKIWAKADLGSGPGGGTIFKVWYSDASPGDHDGPEGGPIKRIKSTPAQRRALREVGALYRDLVRQYKANLSRRDGSPRFVLYCHKVWNPRIKALDTRMMKLFPPIESEARALAGDLFLLRLPMMSYIRSRNSADNPEQKRKRWHLGYSDAVKRFGR